MFREGAGPPPVNDGKYKVILFGLVIQIKSTRRKLFQKDKLSN